MSNTSKFGAAIKGLLGGLGALAAGAAFAFHQFEESEKLVSQTNAVLESTGGVANVTAKDVTNLATALMNKAAVDDEVVRNGENVLLTFTNIRNEVGKGNDIFDRATKLTLDLSVAMGQDMKSSAIQVGKALNDPVAGLTSLSRIGVKFTEQTKEQIATLVEHGHTLEAQKLILRELSTEFKGSAEAQKTASAEMGVALGELAEKIGKLLAPAVTLLADNLVKVVGFIMDNVGPAFKAVAEWFKNAWEAVKPFAETIGNVLIPLFVTMWHTIQDRILPVLERIKPLLIVIGAAIVLFAATVLAQFALVVTAVGFIIDKFLDLVGFIRDKVVEPVVNFLGRIVEAISKIIDWVADKLRPIWGPMKDAAVSAFKAILGPIDFVIDKIKTLIGWIQDAIGFFKELFAAGGAAASVTSQTGRPGVGNQPVPHAATGGFVARSGLAVIHKGETVVPAGAGGVNITVNGWVGSDTQLARKIRDELNKLGDRNAGSGVR